MTARPPLLARLLFAALLAGALVWPALAADEAGLREFAAAVGLRDRAGFAETVLSLRERGRLPERYVTKAQAERLGWRPGRDLCASARGKTIGGDRFGNREGRLPAAPGRTWREADLDFNCGQRGARRLVWSSDGLYFVTVDHYESFRRVPP